MTLEEKLKGMFEVCEAMLDDHWESFPMHGRLIIRAVGGDEWNWSELAQTDEDQPECADYITTFDPPTVAALVRYALASMPLANLADTRTLDAALDAKGDEDE